MPSRENSQLVYATSSGRVKAAPSPAPARPATDGVVRIGFSKQGRGGKPVTTISGVPLDAPGLDDYARVLKQKCGCGGTVRDGIVEIQGDKRDLILADALARGWKAKKAGG
jgi:translation initiation factor 1